MQSEEIQKKFRASCVESFGCEYPSQSPDVREKRRQTFLTRYGHDHPAKVPEIRDKIKKTCKDKYDVSSPLGIYANWDLGFVKRTGRTYKEFNAIISDIEAYRRQVAIITNHQPLHLLPNIDKRSRGNNGYHLDHKFSIIEGFNQNVNPKIIGNIVNLECIPKKQNMSKGANCSITLDELLTAFKAHRS